MDDGELLRTRAPFDDLLARKRVRKQISEKDIDAAMTPEDRSRSQPPRAELSRLKKNLKTLAPLAASYVVQDRPPGNQLSFSIAVTSGPGETPWGQAPLPP
ncbi:MAG: hypothetical protein CM1200mP2_19140 [Planctomycetaceae bacterium]|nr:MAG: hypothetical protein CM1200mP2_19140 [Planctomycetaceae bacterium]